MKIPVFLFLIFFTKQIFGFGDTIYIDTITFENPYEYIKIDTSNECIWQIARPHKVFFDSAFSGEKVIITDSVNYYPTNNLSFFDFKLGNFNCPSFNVFEVTGFCLEFKHKFNTDTLSDGGYITISYDYGETWTNIFLDNNYYFDIMTPYYAYNNEIIDYEIGTLNNGELGFSGRTDEWISTKLEWVHFLCFPKKDYTIPEDTVILRFNFVSDNNDSNKEGWMIDDIVLYSIFLSGGGSVRDFGESDLINIYPNPSDNKTNIELDQTYRDIQIDWINIKGQILSTSQFYNTEYIELQNINQAEDLYFLKITLDHKTVIVKKIFINN